jgi:fermentation-respiration switch protein FrsA (DUF1100 family)
LSSLKFLVGAALVIAGLYCFLAIGMYTFQRKLIYYPDPTHYTPAEVGLSGVREVNLQTPDGVKLVAWESKPARGQPTLLYFHGNAGGLAGRAERIRRFANDGLGVLMLAYRGYGGSEGSPSEAAFIADAQLAYDYLVKEGTQPRQIVAYGESLGTGVAVQLAASRQVGGVILDAPYTSLADIGEELYPFIPVRLFLTDRFASDQHIAGIHAPLLIMHGDRDRTIPLALGQRLFAVAPEPKQMRIIKGAGHSDIYSFGAMQYVRDFLDSTVRQTEPAAR